MQLTEVYCICNFSGSPQIAYKSMEALQSALDNPLSKFEPTEFDLGRTAVSVFQKWERENPKWILDWTTGNIKQTRNFCVQSFLVPEDRVDFFIQFHKGE